MTAIITQKTKGLFMRRLKNDADALSTAHDLDSSDNKYYIAIGKSEDWNDSDNVANASPLITESCLLYTSPSPRDATLSRMPSSA